ncbi:TetR/AcrR family transcriptional regulator [Actinomadura sp. SCN-SB]|uniref:TetR/AcrR family transcriptional regulator n=1 Tax=Actinomadura sp. SCN-SB TaxID=3373092 RepID=UPI0037500637
MSDTSITRRASYGPASPEIGSRGASTRRKIVEVSLELFGEQGFFTTSVDAIAKAAGISRATLYQYFPGKDEIFLELLDECGSALVRVARRIGPLGPTDLGLDNLHWWLGEWSYVFEKYRTMFVQWAMVGSVDSLVRSEVIGFVGRYNQRIAQRLRACDIEGIEPETAAAAMTAIVHRLNLFVHTGQAHDADGETVTTALSYFLQLVLFPGTPAGVLRSLPAEPGTGAAPSAIVIPEPPSTEGLSVEARVAGLTTRAANTVRKLVEAGILRFARNGYHRTNVEDIVEEAGVARGSFYKYFSEKRDLLLAICIQSTAEVLELADRMRAIDLAGDDAELRTWLADFLAFGARYKGAISVAQSDSDDTLVAALSAYSQAVLDESLQCALAKLAHEYPFDPATAAVIFRALISRVPGALKELPEPLDDEQVLDFLVMAIRRGFLIHAAPRPEAAAAS